MRAFAFLHSDDFMNKFAYIKKFQSSKMLTADPTL